MQGQDDEHAPRRGLLPREPDAAIDKPFDARPSRPRPVPVTVDEAIEQRMSDAMLASDRALGGNPDEAYRAKLEEIGKVGNAAPVIDSPLDERAAAIIDQATIAIVDNIATLIQRAERLKQSLTGDTSETKSRISANLRHGARILELSKKMNSELDEIENVHRQQIKG